VLLRYRDDLQGKISIDQNQGSAFAPGAGALPQRQAGPGFGGKGIDINAWQ